MSHINADTGEYLNPSEGRSPRFTSWVFLMMCSVVTLKASTEVKKDLADVNSAAKWAVSCSALTFSVAALVVLAHLIPISAQILVGSKGEGLLTLILVGFWTATVSIVTNTDNDLGAIQSDTNQVSNGNLYYFSWAGFVLSIILHVSYLRSAYGLDLVESLKERATRLTHWAALLAASLVVMGSSARVLQNDCGTNGSETNVAAPSSSVFSLSYCTRTKLAVSLGTLGVVFSMVVVAIKLLAKSTSNKPALVEFPVASLVTVLNVFGVAYITSNSGPGRAIGNLYYASWISFILAAMIAVESFQAKYSQSTAGTTDTGTTTKPQQPSKEEEAVDETETAEDQI